MTILDVVPAIAGVLADIGLLPAQTAESTTAEADANAANTEAVEPTGVARSQPAPGDLAPDAAALARLDDFIAEQPSLTLGESTSASASDLSTDGEAAGMEGVASGLGLVGAPSFFNPDGDSESGFLPGSLSAPDAWDLLTGLLSAGETSELSAISESAIDGASPSSTTLESSVRDFALGTDPGGNPTLSSPGLALAVDSSEISEPGSFGAVAAGGEVADVIVNPEPVTLLLLGTGLIGLAVYRRRRMV